MKQNIKKSMLVLAFSVIFAGQVLAADVGTLKAQGLIGERADGLVGKVVPNADPSVERAIEQINAERLAKYQGVAAKNGLSMDKVQALAGQKLISQTSSGQFVQNGSGNWIKK